MKRYGSVIRVKPDAIAEYKRYHAAVWPDILNMIRKCNIRNYSIYLKDDFLFGYFEYHGTDYQADMAKMAADPRTQEWWAVMMPMQQPLDTRKKESGGPKWRKYFTRIRSCSARRGSRASTRRTQSAHRIPHRIHHILSIEMPETSTQARTLLTRCAHFDRFSRVLPGPSKDP